MRANLPIALYLATGCASTAPTSTAGPTTPATSGAPPSAAAAAPVGRRINPPQLPAAKGYSHVVEVRGGRTLYLSGQVALDRDGNLVGAGDFRAQTEQVFANLRDALAAAGADFSHVVKLTMFVTQLSPEDLTALREIRDRHLPPGPPPASSLVGVTRLVRTDLLVEIEAIAVVPDAL